MISILLSVLFAGDTPAPAVRQCGEACEFANAMYSSPQIMDRLPKHDGAAFPQLMKASESYLKCTARSMHKPGFKKLENAAAIDAVFNNAYLACANERPSAESAAVSFVKSIGAKLTEQEGRDLVAMVRATIVLLAVKQAFENAGEGETLMKYLDGLESQWPKEKSN